MGAGLWLSAILLSSAEASLPNEKAQVVRGAYLTTGILRCFWCHSPLDHGDPAQPRPKSLGAGDVLNERVPIVAPNLTPDRETGLGPWTDAEIIRAVREGIGRKGEPLPTMPSTYYSVLTDEDASAVVSYLRSLRPIRRALPRSAAPPRTGRSVQAAVPPARPENLATPRQLGAYLVQLGECVGCHTPKDRDGNPFVGMEFGGGRRFFLEKGYGDELSPDPWGALPGAATSAGKKPIVASANITPDPSGIPHYSEEIFIQTIRTGKVAGIRPLTAAMPWVFFSRVSDPDLRAIFAYLGSLRPVRHRINNTDPPTACRRCGRPHGLGELN